jgi:hypothetical protein
MQTTETIKNHLTAGAYMKKRDIFMGNLIGGVAWGVGSVLGATIVVAIIISLLRTINFVPVIGSFVGGVLDQVEEQKNQVVTPREK